MPAMTLSTLIVLSAVASSVASTEASGRLPFIADDSERALAEAKSRKLPLFGDVWAPW
jgi:hypothetical protein